jgi:hypothetical protein
MSSVICLKEVYCKTMLGTAGFVNVIERFIGPITVIGNDVLPAATAHESQPKPVRRIKPAWLAAGLAAVLFLAVALPTIRGGLPHGGLALLASPSFRSKI